MHLDPGPDCHSGLFKNMPPAVCDEKYGSLWMGRVDQSTGDAHVCDNYVGHRNDGTANPPQCDPQVYIGLQWHQPGGYEIIYAPLGVNYGGEPPPPLTVRIDIARKDGWAVPDDQKHSNGSVVQIVPQTNPGSLYPAGIFLEIPTLSIDPPSALQRVHLKLKKIAVSSNPAKIRVYRRMPGQWQFEVFLDESTDERPVSQADMGCDWRLDSTAGGVVDLALIAESLDGTELTRDTVRISSTPADPAPGRIVFVNPSSSSPAPPYDNFTLNAAHTIADAVAIMQPEDNVLVEAAGVYGESGITPFSPGVIAGLGGGWNIGDPPIPSYTLADLFDLASLPVIDNSSTTWKPAFTSDGSLTTAGSLTIAGLQFDHCLAGTLGGGTSGAAIHLVDLAPSVTVQIAYCSFASNSAVDFGGAIFLSHVATVSMSSCKFKRNEVVRFAGGSNEYARAMGGAVASIESSLRIQDCSFVENLAEIVGGFDPATLEYLVPPLGCAAGGGDIYVTNGVLIMNGCRSSGARAGIPQGDDIYGAPAQPEFFTGDGGSILVHGRDSSGAAIEILNSRFVNARAYGNGGTISLSYDSSPEGRSYLVYGLSPTPTALSGNCYGQIANATFLNSHGGWQGGAISVNGRLMDISLSDCQFQDCRAGGEAGAVEDGKGGAISICGGIQVAMEPQNSIALHSCNVLRCTSSANGGGLYCTIRGNMFVSEGTVIQECTAQRGGLISPQTSGQGGGIHCSAGAFADVSITLLTNNVAEGNGGGLSVRSATATVHGPVSIAGNHALGTTDETEWGNGGGIFVTTGRHDSAFEGLVAMAYVNDGTLFSAPGGVDLYGNSAARLGGGLYAGWPREGGYVGGAVQLEYATVRLNNANATVSHNGSSLFPAQVVTERVMDDLPQDDNTYFFYASVSFDGTAITGRLPASADIGIYQFVSKPFDGTPNYTPSSLAIEYLAQPPP